MTRRPYYSPSALVKGERCRHAWALHYLDGLVEPSYDWREIEAGRVIVGNVMRASCPQCGRAMVELDLATARCPVCESVTLPRANARQRGASVGGALHSHWEAHYRPDLPDPDWTSEVGLIASAGMPLLPRRESCYRLEIEHAIGDVPTGCDRPPTAMIVHGVPVGGFRDLVAWPDETEVRRLRASTGCLVDLGQPILVDYKGTSDVQRWAKTTDTLRADPAAAAYALDVIERNGLDGVACRWVYFQTKGTHRALPVDFWMSRDDCLRALEPYCQLAKELDAIDSSADAPRSPMRCTDFMWPDNCSGGWAGGCEYHCTVGGPCDQLRPLAAFFALSDRLEKPKMAIDKSKFARAANAAPPPAPPPAAPPVGAAEPPPPEADPAADPAPTPAKPRTRKARSAAAPAAPAGASDYAARQSAAREKIAEGEAELAAVNAEIQAAAEALAALLTTEGEAGTC